MADEMKPGMSTSEFKLASAVAILGAILAGASVTLGQLQTLLPNQAWIAIAGTVVGGLMTLISSLGYAKSRTLVKAAAMAQGIKAPEAVVAPATTPANPS